MILRFAGFVVEAAYMPVTEQVHTLVGVNLLYGAFRRRGIELRAGHEVTQNLVSAKGVVDLSAVKVECDLESVRTLVLQDTPSGPVLRAVVLVQEGVVKETVGIVLDEGKSPGESVGEGAADGPLQVHGIVRAVVGV